jgi:hypothetical protein
MESEYGNWNRFHYRKLSFAADERDEIHSTLSEAVRMTPFARWQSCSSEADFASSRQILSCTLGSLGRECVPEGRVKLG